MYAVQLCELYLIFFIDEFHDLCMLLFLQKWLEDLADSSCATWRVTNSSGEGRINLFKQRLRCQHARTKNLKGVRRSKATGCEAVLHIIVHRLMTFSASI